MIFSVGAGPFPHRGRRLAHIANRAPSGRPASHQSSNPLTQAGRTRTSMGDREFSSFKLHLGAMLEALKPARRLLTFRSTSCASRASVVGNGALMLKRLRL